MYWKHRFGRRGRSSRASRKAAAKAPEIELEPSPEQILRAADRRAHRRYAWVLGPAELHSSAHQYLADEQPKFRNRPFETPEAGPRLFPWAALITVVALAAAFFVDSSTDPSGDLALVAAVLLTGGLATSIPLVPWARLPAAAQLAVPLLYLVVVALVCSSSAAGVPDACAALVLVPVLWLALYGSRGQLAVLVAAIPVSLLASDAAKGIDDPAAVAEWATLWTLVAGGLGFVVQGLVAERAELLAGMSELARTDALTGLPNRRELHRDVARELAKASREGTPLAVAMVDMDDFKRFNDRNGHDAGDRVLRDTAIAWSEVLRPSDVLARHGGDEFAVLLPGTDLEEALAVMARVRDATPHDQTASCGVATSRGSEEGAAILHRADRALFAAKRGGRDRTATAA